MDISLTVGSGATTVLLSLAPVQETDSSRSGLSRSSSIYRGKMITRKGSNAPYVQNVEVELRGENADVLSDKVLEFKYREDGMLHHLLERVLLDPSDEACLTPEGFYRALGAFLTVQIGSKGNPFVVSKRDSDFDTSELLQHYLLPWPPDLLGTKCRVVDREVKPIGGALLGPLKKAPVPSSCGDLE